MAKPHPSELLASLSSTVPAETFIKMLPKSLYPALDALPAAQRRNIVSTIAPRYPSELLASLSSNVPAQAFSALLSKSLYPALDSLPDAQRSNIVSILETTLKTDVKRAEWVERVGYEAMAKSLRSQLAELKKDVRHNWKSGYEDQVSEERPLIQKCLKLCHDIMDQVEDCGSR
ncbi:hypothetical protein JB92DRAFT_2847614 [Gautieria morchelliformis]|nr:hypothetical protein JB92DRAFT_2847614 [Gautieria morchelliformis]